MERTATISQTVMAPSIRDGYAIVEFWRDGEYYIFPTQPHNLKKVLMLVEACADDEKQNLTWDDCLAISNKLRELINRIEDCYAVDEVFANRLYVYDDSAPKGIVWCVITGTMLWGAIALGLYFFVAAP